MASSFTPNKNIEKPGHNDYVDDWDVPVNANSDVLDSSLAGVSYVNLTGLSSYTLTYSDLRARTIVFTGTLNNSIVDVKLTNGVSYEGNLQNGTTAGGSSSFFRLGWTGSGNTYILNQNATQYMVADGLNPSSLGWQPGAPQVRVATSSSNAGVGELMTSFVVTGVGSTQTMSAAEARAKVIKFTGVIPNAPLIYQLPAVPGIWGIHYNVSAAGGSSTLILSVVGGNGFQIPTGAGGLLAVSDGSQVYGG